MTIFSLDEAQVVDAIRAISEPGVFESAGIDAHQVAVIAAERFAHATWSGIAEPGDVVAGALVRTLGASQALTALVERRSSTAILDAVAGEGPCELTAHDVSSAIERWRPRLAANAAVTSLRLAARCGARLIIPTDASWPAALNDLGQHEPVALWVRGTTEAVRSMTHSVALVGARAATGYGEQVAMELSAGLSDRGWGIVSGAAYGIDGMAHRAALASSGLTVAYLAGGVDRFYPSGHDSLLARITQTGLVVSELPCGSPPTKWRFLQRNRLIAATARATVVVEAGSRSGSLNTAAHAASIGRPLGAVPGPVTSMASAGCHRLLREYDATCVTTTDEVIELLGEPEDNTLGGIEDMAEFDRPKRRPDDHTRLLDALSWRASRTPDDIAKRAGLSVSAVQSLLGVLGLQGEVDETPQGWKRRPATAAKSRAT